MEEIESEKDLEIRIRNNLKDLFSDTDFILLENKDVVDIVILNDKPQKLFFIELKFFKKCHLRFGNWLRRWKRFSNRNFKKKIRIF